jgi:DnaJ like chaperone protein
MSIWEQIAAAIADVSVETTTLGKLLGANKQDISTEDAVPFTLGMVTLGAKMAKADGVIDKDEIQAFKKAFKVSDLEMKVVARIFNRAKQNAAGYETCSEEIVAALGGDRRLLEYVLEGLFLIANADGMMHPQEEKFLGHVAKLFGFTECDFALMKARHTVGSEPNPYDVLGVKPSVSNEELEKQYRRLVAESQTEEFRVRGMPKEFIRIATTKLAAIKGAYEAIAKERNIGV